MPTLLLVVGRLRPTFRTACDDYLRRLRRFGGGVVEREVREAGRAATPELRRREESARLGAAVPQGGTVIALHREGFAWSSRDLARQLDRWLLAPQPVTLLIGGAFGLDPGLLGRAHASWSLGPLTFPHELTRVIVLEQWYRAWTILRGQPYHKG